MPSPWNTSPSPRRSIATSRLNEPSTFLLRTAFCLQNLVRRLLFVHSINLISIIQSMNTAAPDLNLLQTFFAVHAAGSVSAAAQRLGVSQPTVSHALRRLRELYQDPLFIRTGAGMAPTAKADRLAEAVRHALHLLDVAIQEGEHFDARVAQRTFRLHMTDIGETVFLPRLMHTLAARAPGLRIETAQLDEKDVGPALETGRIDLAVGFFPDLAAMP